jgi:hypothetical protein
MVESSGSGKFIVCLYIPGKKVVQAYGRLCKIGMKPVEVFELFTALMINLKAAKFGTAKISPILMRSPEGMDLEPGCRYWGS